MKKNIALFLLLMGSLFSMAQNKVIQLPAKSAEGESLPQTNGFYYMLPKTVFKIDVTVTRTNEIKGYYADYAEKLLGLNNVITANKSSFKLADVRISTFEVPDTSSVYFAELSKNQRKNDFLSKIYQKDDTSSQLVFSRNYSTVSTQLPDFFRNYSELTYVEEEDSYVVKQLVDSIMTEVPVNTTKKVTKTVEQKAKEAADFIIQIRKDRYDLTAGAQEVAYGREALELMISELNKWEKNYTDLFTGITVEEDLHYVVFVSPDAENNLDVPLFSLSSTNGFSTDMDEKEENNNYYLNFVPQLNHTKKQQFLLEKQKDKKFVPNDGYCIRKPVLTEVSLHQNQQTDYVWGFFPVHQFGAKEFLPAHLDGFEILKYVILY